MPATGTDGEREGKDDDRAPRLRSFGPMMTRDRGAGLAASLLLAWLLAAAFLL